MTSEVQSFETTLLRIKVQVGTEQGDTEGLMYQLIIA